MTFCVSKLGSSYSRTEALRDLERKLEDGREQFVRTGKWPYLGGVGAGRVSFTDMIYRNPKLEGTLSEYYVDEYEDLDPVTPMAVRSIVSQELKRAEGVYGTSGVYTGGSILVALRKTAEWAEEVEDRDLYVVATTLLRFLDGVRGIVKGDGDVESKRGGSSTS